MSLIKTCDLNIKITHRILAFFLVGIFVLPNVVQLDHFLHEHKTHEVCESHDWEQHIHSDTDENCSYLHKIANPDLSLQAFSNQLSKSICKYHIISNKLS